jgi:hypothetical protein
MIIHPEGDTGLKRFGYSRFKRKFLFLRIGISSVSGNGRLQAFPCAPRIDRNLLKRKN